MRILIYNEFTRMPGGTDVVALMHYEILKKMNIDCRLVEFNHIDFIKYSFLNKIETFYKVKVKADFNFDLIKNEIQDFKPHIVHIHNIYPLSEGIFRKIYTIHKKVVFHLHNYYPLCINSYFFSKQSICELCAQTNSYKSSIIKKCYDDSYVKTFLLSKNRLLPKEWVELSDNYNFIAVSKFVKDKYISYGVKENKVEVIYNPIENNDYSIDNKENKEEHQKYVLFIGRYNYEKGLDLLINAIKETPEVLLYIMGTETKAISIKKISEITNIKNIGFATGYKKYQIVSNAKFVIIPSLWHEAFGLSALEANSYGKYVLTSGQGGLREIVKKGINGEYFDPYSRKDLVKKIKKLWERNLEQTEGNCIEESKKYSNNYFFTRMINYYEGLIN